MDTTNSSNELYRALSPAIRLCQVVALLPGSFSFTEGFHIQKWSVLYSVALLTLLLTTSIYRFIISVSHVSEASMLAFGPLLLDFFGVPIYYVTCIVTSIFYHSSLLKQYFTVVPILDHLLFVDTREAYKCLGRFTKKCVILILLLVAVKYTWVLLQSWISHTYENIYYCWFIFLLSTLPSLKFVTFACVLKNRFQLLNTILKNMCNGDKQDTAISKILHELDNGFFSQTSLQFKKSKIDCSEEDSLKRIISGLRINKEFKEILRSLRAIHLCLSKMANQVEQVFKLQNFLNICTVVFFIVIDVYTLSFKKTFSEDKYVNHFSSNSTMLVVVQFFMDTVQDLFHLFLICWVCNEITSESRRTQGLLSEIHIMENLSEEAQVELNNFHQQVSTLKVHFSVGGFFNINLKLYFGIVSTLITYSVLILQFGAYVQQGSSLGEQLYNTTLKPA